MDLRRRHRITSEVASGSLNDIMFFLLLFFLITSTLVNPNIIKLMLPKGGAKEISPKGITVSIDKDGKFYLNKNIVDIERLPERIKEVSKGKDDVIVVAADETVPVGEVVRIMNIGRSLKLKVLLATDKQGNGVN